MNAPDLPDAQLALHLYVPLRLGRGGNTREHPWTAARRAKQEREAMGWAFVGYTRVDLPVRVTLIRNSPARRPMDGDNLVASLKHVRDGVARFLMADDADRRIEWKCEQCIGCQDWGVEIKIERTQ